MRALKILLFIAFWVILYCSVGMFFYHINGTMHSFFGDAKLIKVSVDGFSYTEYNSSGYYYWYLSAVILLHILFLLGGLISIDKFLDK